MIEQDTVRLLRECDAGVKMGISSIEDVLPRVTGKGLYGKLDSCRKEHDVLQGEIQELLDKYSVVTTAAVGEAFDANFHNAVMHIEDETMGENVVAEIFQQGYKMGDRVLRHAMVKVAN